MSGGITSYPRTGGGGGSALAEVKRLLRQLDTGSVAGNDINAQALLAALERFSQQGRHTATVALSQRVRDALFNARNRKHVSRGWHGDAMEICADAYKQTTPFSSTVVYARSQVATSTLAQPGISLAQKRQYKETLGVCAAIYEISALLGDDVSATLMAQATTFSNHWSYNLDASGDLTYLESAGAYSVNLMMSIEIPGCPEPMVIAAEAKGGNSMYKDVRGPSGIIAKVQLKPPISQKSLIYAISRAWYMERERGNALHQVQRKNAGSMILKAAADNRLTFVAARGDASPANTQTTQRDHLECQ